MNQAIAFARTLRALDADDFRASRLGLLVAALLLAAWAWWLFSARVPQYETTNLAWIYSSRVVAGFRSTIQIRPGQPAIVNVGGGAFPARVESVAYDHAELVLAPNPQSPIPTGSSVSVQIEVSRVSPASIALQSLGISNR